MLGGFLDCTGGNLAMMRTRRIRLSSQPKDDLAFLCYDGLVGSQGDIFHVLAEELAG